jgi:hypothetical protein
VETCVAGLPALWLLAPGTLDAGAVSGHPRGDVYGTLAVAEGAARGVDPGLSMRADPTLTFLAPLVRAAGAPWVLECLLVLGVVAGAAVLHGFVRRVLPAPEDAWARILSVAAGLAGPATVLAWGEGRPSGAQPWALVLPALVVVARGGAGGVAVSVLAGALVGALGCGMIPGAALVLLASGLAVASGGGVAEGGGPPPAPGAVVRAASCLASAVVVAHVVGWHPREPAWDLARALAVPSRGPDPEFAAPGFVGVVAGALLVLALLHRDGRPWAGAAALGLLLPGARLVGPSVLHAIPLLAVLGASCALRRVWPAGAGSAMVLLGTLLLAEGWKGAGGPLPIPTAPLAVPAAARDLPVGRVLDLPLRTGAPGRAAWWRVHHGRPGAVEPDGTVAVPVEGRARALMDPRGMGCRSPADLGFASVLARREGELPDVGPLVACLGPPTVDDGAVARWDLAPTPSGP